MSLRLGIIGAGGWLGGAIAQAALAGGVASPDTLSLSYRSKPPVGCDGAFQTRDTGELVERSDVIILSVRPEDWPEVRFDATGKLLISVMAAVDLQSLASAHNTPRVIRALPNAATEVAASFTPLVSLSSTGSDDLAIASSIFACCGVVDEVATEEHLDYFAGLTGTGPAYPALMALAMEQDAIARGIDPAVAGRAVKALFVGTGRLLETFGTSPADTVEAFMAYRGITAAGLETMQAMKVGEAVKAGLEAALVRGRAMAGKS